MPDPQPLTYATPARQDTRPPGGPVLTGATVGWRTAAGAAWLAGVLGAAGFTLTTLYGQQQSMPVGSLVAGGLGPSVAGLAADFAGPAAFAAAAGAVAAVVLYHWTAARLAWVAALPAVAGAGSPQWRK